VTVSETKPKSFKLSLVNAAEDVPRLVRAYGRACDGEFALVLRPTEERGVLVLVRKKEGALSWRSGSAAEHDSRHRAEAEVVRHVDGSLRLSPRTVGSGDATWLPYDPAGLRVGQRVTMAFHPDDQFAHIVTDDVPAHTDAPGIPSTAITAADAVALVKTEQKAVPKPGPITLRGQWSGTLTCDGGAPRVELVRKLAAYGVLRVVSGPNGWTWTVERAEKWFSRPGSDTGGAATLIRAIEGGLARAMGLLGEACSVRDSRRRAALDTAYATVHPVQPAKEGKDPTERFDPKEPKRSKAKVGSPWRHYGHGEEPPEADPIDRPTRAVLARVKQGGLTHDAGAGTFLGRTVEVFDGFPAGSLVFREPDSDAGFYMHPPLAQRARNLRAAAAVPMARPVPAAVPSAPAAGDVDAEKDKALLDAFSQAIVAAMHA
jgi:hypothetical protein